MCHSLFSCAPSTWRDRAAPSSAWLCDQGFGTGSFKTTHINLALHFLSMLRLSESLDAQPSLSNPAVPPLLAEAVTLCRLSTPAIAPAETPQHPLIWALTKDLSQRAALESLLQVTLSREHPKLSANNWSVPCPRLWGTQGSWDAEVLDFQQAMPLHHKIQPCFVTAAIILGTAAKSILSPFLSPAMPLA